MKEQGFISQIWIQTNAQPFEFRDNWCKTWAKADCTVCQHSIFYACVCLIHDTARTKIRLQIYLWERTPRRKKNPLYNSQQKWLHNNEIVE